MILETELFGKLEIVETDTITFPEGLLGFPAQKKYVFFELTAYPPFVGMQCIDDPALSFITVDPRLFVGDYEVCLDEAERTYLGFSTAGEMAVYTIVVLHSDPAKITTNLLGPIVVNPVTRVGKQLVMSGDCYELKYQLYNHTAQGVG